MSISHLNVPSVLAALLTAFLSYACATTPPSATTPTSGPTRLTAADVAKARQVALPALKSSVDEPVARVPILKFAAAPVWSDSGASHKALLLVSFTYPGARYAYCRLVTVSADFASAEVADANAMPYCLGISHAVFVDVNGDGELDVVASLRVQSNRYDAVLEAPGVFLSDSSAPSGYCFSQQASDHLNPDDLATGERARASLERERKRLGLPRFACGAA